MRIAWACRRSVDIWKCLQQTPCNSQMDSRIERIMSERGRSYRRQPSPVQQRQPSPVRKQSSPQPAYKPQSPTQKPPSPVRRSLDTKQHDNTPSQYQQKPLSPAPAQQSAPPTEPSTPKTPKKKKASKKPKTSAGDKLLDKVKTLMFTL